MLPPGAQEEADKAVRAAKTAHAAQQAADEAVRAAQAAAQRKRDMDEAMELMNRPPTDEERAALDELSAQ
jgi:hypothetical protein